MVGDPVLNAGISAQSVSDITTVFSTKMPVRDLLQGASASRRSYQLTEPFCSFGQSHPLAALVGIGIDHFLAIIA